MFEVEAASTDVFITEVSTGHGASGFKCEIWHFAGKMSDTASHFDEAKRTGKNPDGWEMKAHGWVDESSRNREITYTFSEAVKLPAGHVHTFYFCGENNSAIKYRDSSLDSGPTAADQWLTVHQVSHQWRPTLTYYST